MNNLVQIATEGFKFQEMGRVKEAEERFRLLATLSDNPTAPIILATLLPAIYASMDDLHQWRRRLETNLRDLVARGIRLDVAQHFAAPEFYAQYHGLNDRELQILRAKLYLAPQFPGMSQKRNRAPGEKIRVGVISRYFRDHTIGRLNQGLVAKLPRERFELTVLSAMTTVDPIADFFKKHADRFVQLPPVPDAARQVVAGGKFDILYYTDLGMDPISYTLALTRMAPVQCTTWGHPVTSGLPTMDYFISAEGLEPAPGEERGCGTSDGQYTEKVVRLKDLAVYYYRPEIPMGGAGTISGSGRAEFNLPEDAHLYGCFQSLYKLHPEFDSILAGILRGDPNAIILLLSGPYPEWNTQLMNRFAGSMPDVAGSGRIRFMPRGKRDGFLRLNRVCDVILDPLHFGGGNTTYEALALGRPVVTLPSGMLRGRLAYKMYQTMDLFDCVVQTPGDYIATALRLGTEPDYAREIRNKIDDRSPILFENPAGIAQLAEFWQSVA